MYAWMAHDSDLGPSLADLEGMLPSGARVVALHQNFLTEPAYELALPSHAAKVVLLDRLADHDAAHPVVRRLAEHLTSESYGLPLAAAEDLHSAVRDGVTFSPEKVETFQHTLRTLATQRGDCDDSVRALVALARSIGVPARLLTLGSPPTHVWTQLGVGGRWLHAETTLPQAQLGEHPLRAKARSRSREEREDLR